MRLINADELKKTIIETLERIRKNPKMSRDEMHILAACDTMCQMIDDMPTVPKQDFCKNDDELRKRQWISVEERLPEPEQEVLVFVDHKNGYNEITTALYENGRITTGDSCWNWYDLDFDYDEEQDDYLIPQGWWEYRHYNPDDVYNNCIDGVVTHWQPLPEPPKEREENAR